MKGIIPDLDRILWKGRKVIIAFDSDIEDNSSVQAARHRLTSVLIQRGATVGCLEWPAAEGKGVDDRLAAVGPEKVLADIAELFSLEIGGLGYSATKTAS